MSGPARTKKSGVKRQTPHLFPPGAPKHIRIKGAGRRRCFHACRTPRVSGLRHALFSYFATSQMVTGTGTSCSVRGETGRLQMRLWRKPCAGRASSR